MAGVIEKAQLRHRLRRGGAPKGARALLPIGHVAASGDSDKSNGSDREAEFHSVRSIALTQLYPLAPATPAPGCMAGPHSQSPRIGVRYPASPGKGRIHSAWSSDSSM